MANTPVTAIRLDDELKADLKKLADADRRDFSDYVRLVLADHVAAKKGLAAKRKK